MAATNPNKNIGQGFGNVLTWTYAVSTYPSTRTEYSVSSAASTAITAKQEAHSGTTLYFAKSGAGVANTLYLTTSANGTSAVLFLNVNSTNVEVARSNGGLV